jgi:hypothetical protein
LELSSWPNTKKISIDESQTVSQFFLKISRAMS